MTKWVATERVTGFSLTTSIYMANQIRTLCLRCDAEKMEIEKVRKVHTQKSMFTILWKSIKGLQITLTTLPKSTKKYRVNKPKKKKKEVFFGAKN